MNLPGAKKKLLDNITGELKLIKEVVAVTLGGSYAVGLATDDSDLDIGIYYSEQAPFDIEKVRFIAEKFAGDENPTVTGFYEWGPWVNGGAWINTANGKVDLLYKNIEQIRETIDNAQKGIYKNDFEQQPPYGFSSIIFLAESYNSLQLYDPAGVIEELKNSVRQYPQKLKQSVIQQSLWSAEFTIWQAQAFSKKEDVYNTVGCLTRTIKNIVSALFAINEIYPMGDKRALQILESSEIKPVDLTSKINDILYYNNRGLVDNVAQLKKLFRETITLGYPAYKSRYNI